MPGWFFPTGIWAGVDMLNAGILFLSYLSGSIPFGLILTKLFTSKDVRESGSGNIGATNVARVAGKKIGALVLILDALKAAIPVLISQHFFPMEMWLHCAVGLVAFLGHVFPIWLKFKGGKGVASALGVLLVLNPLGALLGFAVWIIVMALFRISSIGSLLGGTVSIVSGFLLSIPQEYAWLGIVLLMLMVFTHRENLKRIWAKTENKV
jgi:acyl phosphate:glycerol-3-phosphate acyltransferase